ncbi:MAG: ATP-grasp domain-containing protein [candidate division KSB1 bacterium]|nr:ATP-grasp domain-containing protein [candidate division KSB1 bacterium]MDZ7364435.1 ATP-grasp domain-containing protein [candidate division KSB1 bacterium]MDZ7402807.1 ATP-grasp domain-containing protein [candidate division KSB1 bacterium]
MSEKILIAYNVPKREQRGRDIDFLSEAGVMDEVNAVREALLECGYAVGIAGVQRSAPMFLDRVMRFRPKAIFNLVEGWQGDNQYEMHFACTYELLGVPYTGAPPLALATAVNKWHTKTLLKQAKLPTPNGMICSEVPGRCSLRYPVIVKPVHEDASLGVDFDAVVSNLAELRRRVAWVVQTYHQPAIVEEYIEGRELNVAVVGDEIPLALPISEITFDIPAHLPKICTYNAKWLAGSEDYQWTAGAQCPARLDEALTRQIQSLAVSAFHVMGCRDYGRVDFRLSPDNQPYILEVNPNPDISPDAGLARSARASGRTYTQLIGEVIHFALQRGTHDSYGHSHPAFAPRRPTEHRTHFAADASLSRNGSAVRVGAD